MWEHRLGVDGARHSTAVWPSQVPTSWPSGTSVGEAFVWEGMRHRSQPAAAARLLSSRIGLRMPRGWLGNGERWLGPKRGNLGSKGTRDAQRKREAEKRKLARAKARAARDAAGEVVKSGFNCKAFASEIHLH